MKLISASAAAFAAALLAFACSSDDTLQGGTFVPGSGGGCAGLDFVGSCGECSEARCCGVVASCHADASCRGCIDPQATGCSGPKAEALLSCIETQCKAECLGPSLGPDCAAKASSANGACVPQGGENACNPVTNASCDSDVGEACDAKEGGGFTCYPKTDTAGELCAACDISKGSFCAAGMRCFKGKCARYCCTDADCGSGTCEHVISADVGLCVVPEVVSSTGSASGAPATSGSGGGSATTSGGDATQSGSGGGSGATTSGSGGAGAAGGA